MARQTSQTEASARPRRTPVAKRNRLEIQNKEAGYVYRIVNDVDDRVQQLQEQGYEVVPNAKVGAIGNRRVDNPTALGSSSHISVGQGTKAVVMRQREEFYREDQQIKQQTVDDTEQSMKNPQADYGSIKREVKFSEG
jgi:hypothetical protein